MSALLLDKIGAASRLAAEGKFALGRGETELAAERYAAAGKEIEQRLAAVRRAGEAHLLRFLAATQYYLGGHYPKALKLAGRVETRFLDQPARDIFPGFLKAVRERAAPDYQPRMRQRMLDLWQAREFGRALDVLRDHHFLYEQGPLAFLRAVLCEELRMWSAAAVFYAAAIPGVKDGSDFLLMAVSRAMGMPAEGRIEEAWEYISRLRMLLPGAVTNLVSSIVCFSRAANATGEERLALHREQIRYFQDGWRLFQELPVARQMRHEMRLIASIGFNAVAIASMRLGDKVLAAKLADEAIQFQPDAPEPLTARGMLNYPSDFGVNDFRRAAAMPSCGYPPFLYLAHHAFQQGLVADAERLVRDALARGPGRQVRAVLLCWLALFRDSLNAPQEEVEAFFREACETDPTNSQVVASHERFMAIKAAGLVGRADWDIHIEKDSVEPDFLAWPACRPPVMNRDKRVRDTLSVGVG